MTGQLSSSVRAGKIKKEILRTQQYDIAKECHQQSNSVNHGGLWIKHA